eukprot:g3491.t1
MRCLRWVEIVSRTRDSAILREKKGASNVFRNPMTPSASMYSTPSSSMYSTESLMSQKRESKTNILQPRIKVVAGVADEDEKTRSVSGDGEDAVVATDERKNGARAAAATTLDILGTPPVNTETEDTLVTIDATTNDVNSTDDVLIAKEDRTILRSPTWSSEVSMKMGDSKSSPALLGGGGGGGGDALQFIDEVEVDVDDDEEDEEEEEEENVGTRDRAEVGTAKLAKVDSGMHGRIGSIMSSAGMSSFASEASTYSDDISERMHHRGDSDAILKRGTILKLKKGGVDQWKPVDLILRPNSIEYSYLKKMAPMMSWRVNHKIRLQDMEQVIVSVADPRQFTIDMLIGTPIPLMGATAKEASSWTSALRSAHAPHQELISARNRELDAVSSKTLVSDDCDDALAEPSVGEMIDLGYMWKKSKVWKEWRIRRFRLEPHLGLLQYSRPEDPVGLTQPEQWYIQGGRIEPVDVNLTIDVYAAAERGGEPKTVLSIRCFSMDDMVRNLDAMIKAGAEPTGCLVVYKHLSEDFVNDVYIRVQHRMKKISIDQIWPKDTCDAIARYLTFTVSKNSRNEILPDDEKVEMRIDLARSAPVLQRRASCQPSTIALGCMVFNGRRRRLVLKGFYLETYKPESHYIATTTEELSPLARYIIRGSAVSMRDIWKCTLKVHCLRVNGDNMDAASSGVHNECDIVPERGVEQLWKLLHLLRKHGAQLDRPCKRVHAIVRRLRNDPDALANAMEKVEAFDRDRLAKDGDVWVPLASVVTNKLELTSLMNNIASEFKSRKFQQNFFEAATIHAGGKRVSKELRSGRFSSRRRHHRGSADSTGSAASLDDARAESIGGFDSSAHNVSGKIAIFVLGPSAAGKTHRTKANLSQVLQANALPGDLSFVSIDGGIMRDSSELWKYAKDLRMKEKTPIKGFSDLFKGYFQMHIRAFKRKLFKSLLDKGVNMVIPETAASLVGDRCGSWLKRLRAANYTVVMTAVHASRATCNRNGKKREVEEGKKYSNFSWIYAMRSIEKYFNVCRSLGYHKETFFVVDNTDWKHNKMVLVPPRQGIYLEIISSDSDDQGIFKLKSLSSIPFNNSPHVRSSTDSIGKTFPPKGILHAKHRSCPELNVSRQDLVGVITRGSEKRETIGSSSASTSGGLLSRAASWIERKLPRSAASTTTTPMALDHLPEEEVRPLDPSSWEKDAKPGKEEEEPGKRTDSEETEGALHDL